MRCPKWISAQDLDRWAATPQAKPVLPELLRRLVLATVSREHLQKVDFPSGAETHRPSYDGTTVVTQPTPFVPSGVTFWELGCVVRKAKGKAQEDYDTRITEHQKRVAKGETEDLKEVTFIAVTALDWQKAENWAQERTKDGHFKTVRAYDSNCLEHWIQDAPAVGLWLAQQILGKRDGLTDLGGHWANVQATLRHPLPPKVLLIDRDDIGTVFADWLGKPNGELSVKAPSAAELVAVFCAWVLTLPPERQDEISSRAIIVEERETWRALATSQQRLILIASPRLESDSELLAEAVRQGHHVLRFAEFRTPRSTVAVELGMMRRFDLQEALKEAGFQEFDARQLAEAAGGNFTILRRRLARNPDSPGWAQDNALAPLLLAAAWEDRRADDQRIIAQLADKRYTEVESLMVKWRQEPDAPVRMVTGTWEFLSPPDAWEALHPFVTTTQMDCFERIAVEVLSEDDPSLELPAEERYMAAIKGKVWRFSHALRRGVAEMLALGATREDQSCVGTELRFAARATSIVRRLLPASCTWKRWASLGDLLPLLMEASPDAVLEAIERDIVSTKPQLVELMRQEISGGITGAAYHTGVLWALETAAWPKERVQRVALCLTRLGKLDPGGKWANRPQGSATGVFLYWRPQTVASIGERVETLRFLCQKEPEGAWKLLLSLVPNGPGMFMDSAKPSYRDWAAGWTGKITQADCDEFLSELTNMVVAMVGIDSARWPRLLDKIRFLPSTEFPKVLAALESFNTQCVDVELRTMVWTKLRTLVEDHTRCQDAWWALPASELNKVAVLTETLAPADLVTLSTHLFDSAGVIDRDKALTYEQKIERRCRERRVAVRGIWNARGISALMELALKVRLPRTVGWSLAEEIGVEAEPHVVPSLLAAEDNAIKQFARAFAAQRIQIGGHDWAEAQPSSDWQPEQVASWALEMSFEARTWDWVASKGAVVERLYWSETGTLGGAKLDVAVTERAAKQLQAVGRAWSALEHLMMALYERRPLTAAVVCDALDSVAANPAERNPNTMDAHYIDEAFGFLHQCADADEARVARLEFTFLHFLDGHSRLPVTLQRQLARDPAFFVECLKFLYHPRHKEAAPEAENKALDPEKAERAKRIWRLLHDWQIIPGTGTDGVVSLDGLRAWVLTARQKARESDRLEVCDVTLGELFARSKEDADKAKPVVAIREVIEECESAELDRGLAIGLHNLRGFHSKGAYEGGKQERGLAAKYEQYATICSRWPRTAAVHRGVAKGYLEEAAYEDERALARD